MSNELDKIKNLPEFLKDICLLYAFSVFDILQDENLIPGKSMDYYKDLM